MPNMTKKDILKEIKRLVPELSDKADHGLMQLNKDDQKRLLTILQIAQRAPVEAANDVAKILPIIDECENCKHRLNPADPNWKFEDGLCDLWLLAEAEKTQFCWESVTKCKGFEPKRTEEETLMGSGKS